MIKLQCRKVPSVLRLFTPTKDKNYGPNAHHLLILYYSFWKESDLKSGSQPSYANKSQKVAVLQLVNENKQKVEPYIDEALIRHNIESTSKRKSKYSRRKLINWYKKHKKGEITEASENAIPDIPFTNKHIYQSDDEISTNSRSLNFKQQHWTLFILGQRKL